MATFESDKEMNDAVRREVLRKLATATDDARREALRLRDVMASIVDGIDSGYHVEFGHHQSVFDLARSLTERRLAAELAMTATDGDREAVNAASKGTSR